MRLKDLHWRNYFIDLELEKKCAWCTRGKMAREEATEATGLETVVVLT